MFYLQARRRMFEFAVAVALAVSASLPTFASEVHGFDIAAKDASSAIRDFGSQARVQILVAGEHVKGKQLHPLSGEFSTDEGLKILLADSGLTAQYVGDRSIALVPTDTTNTSSVASDETLADANAAPLVEIIVTARRRSESSIATPVILTGVSQEEIDRRHLTRIDELNNVVPQLQIGQGSIQGGSVVLRGIGANANTTTADQAVTFNIDGAQVARSSIRRIGQMDLAQIEVLKGPQALFFGKNSPGGVISIRTADPTRDFDAKVSALYEFIGREIQFESFASGPLTDTLGVRVGCARRRFNVPYRGVDRKYSAGVAAFR